MSPPPPWARALLRAPLRVAVGTFQRVRRFYWYFRRPRTFGAHAVPVTPSGALVLVKLTYARGWRLPGGGRKMEEDAKEAVIRELREEIGMTAHGAVENVAELRDDHDYKQDTVALFIVRDVEYSPRWSLEVEAVREVPADRLPSDTSDRARRWIEAARPFL